MLSVIRLKGKMPVDASLLFAACLAVGFVAGARALEPRDVGIVILSQREGYHSAHADFLRKGILEQAAALEKDPPVIVLSHESGVNGTWTITPLLRHLPEMHQQAKWFFFCLENTVIRLNKLLNVLSKYESNKNVWVGHALYDHEPTIIHHFAEHDRKFKYPHLASGFAISSGLIHSLLGLLEEQEHKDYFSIDASYEFASFVAKLDTAVRLTHVPEICIVSSSDCASYPRFFHPCATSISSENVYFAVKTCTKYHRERIPIIKNTWAKYATNIGYFSDAADKYLPEAYVVPNTTNGHCAKTYAILKKANSILQRKQLDWLIVSDDDTLFSMARLLRLLTCYNPKHSLAIGERYGFRILDNLHGYEYLTGGAGVVLSAPLVTRILKSAACECPAANAPDDMYLFGVCFARLGVQPTHSTLFHQARPSDYATAFLASQEPLSFHKFWMIDPQMVYDEWFAEADSVLSKITRHTEL